MKSLVSRNKFHPQLSSYLDIKGVVKRQFVASSQADRGMNQLSGGDDEFKLKVIEGIDRPQGFAFRKARVMKQGIGHLIGDQIRSDQLGFSMDMRIPKGNGQEGIGFILNHFRATEASTTGT